MENIVETILTRNVDARRASILPFEHVNMVSTVKGKCELNPYEIAEAFPGIEAPLRKRRSMIAKEANTVTEDANRELSESTEAIYMAEGVDAELLSSVANETCTLRKFRYEKELRRMDKLLGIFAGMRMSEEDPGSITDADVARAKEAPIEDFIEVRRRDRMVCCPFHSEKTPSCKIYKDNHWYCFGACQQGGDVIDIVMKLENLDFLQAVRRIIGKPA